MNTENVFRQGLVFVVGTIVGLVPADRCTLDTTSALGKRVAFVAASLGFVAEIVVAAALLSMDATVGNSLEDWKVVVELKVRG